MGGRVLAERIRDYSDRKSDAAQRDVDKADKVLGQDIEFPSALKPSEFYKNTKAATEMLWSLSRLVGWGNVYDLAGKFVDRYSVDAKHFNNYVGKGKKEKRVIGEINGILKSVQLDSVSVEDGDVKVIKRLIAKYSMAGERAETAASNTRSKKGKNYFYKLAGGSFGEAEHFSAEIGDYGRAKEFENAKESNIRRASDGGLTGKLVLSFVGLLLIASIFVSFSTVTGNVVGGLTMGVSSMIGVGLFVIGLISSYFYFRKKQKKMIRKKHI